MGAPHGMLWMDELPGVFTETGWTPPEGGMPFGEWERGLAVLKRERARKEAALDAILWALADWLNWGEGFYRERHSQALDATDYAGGSLHNIARTGRGVPPEVREVGRVAGAGVSFWKQTEVVGLPAETQKQVLGEAGEENYTRAEIRDAAEAYRKSGRKAPDQEGLNFGPPPSGGGGEVIQMADHKDTCPTCGGTGTVVKAEAARPIRWEVVDPDGVVHELEPLGDGRWLVGAEIERSS